jgi:hypothetical protein
LNQRLSDWASIAEIVGAVAIVVSLIYVALEVQQNTRVQHALAYQEVYRDLKANLAAIPTELMAKQRSGEDLSDLERREIAEWFTTMMRGYENWWQQCRLGTITDEIFQAYISHLRVTMSTTLARETWGGASRLIYLQGFRDFVDAYLANNPLDIVEVRVAVPCL